MSFDVNTGSAYKPPGAPGMGGGPPPGDIKNWLVESILVTVCCCLPLGIAGIVFALQVNSKKDAGDWAGAMKASQNAKTCLIIGVVGGLIANILVIGLQIAAAAAANQ